MTNSRRAAWPAANMFSPLLASLALATAFFLPGARADNCTVEPFALLVRNVTFPNGIGANRGVKLVLGDQIQGMRMSTILNNTRVRNILDCPSTNETDLIGCQGASGSIYSTTDGSFDQVNDDSDWDVPVIDPQPNDGSTTVVHGYDIANFTDGPAVIPEYPLEVWANREAVNLSALALGPKSSTLQRLVKNNLSPSSSFGLDYGSTSELHPRDGQLVFGGVNEARFDMDKRTEFDMWGAGASVNCPLQILLSDVLVTNEDGDHSLLPDKDSKISACIDTIQNSFTLTDSMFEKFQEIGNHIEDDGSEYKPSVFPGDRDSLLGTLTIRFSNGYSSVIPHYELINHERGTDDQGKYAVLNNSRIAASVSSGQSDLGANVPILGGVFLSQNYLQVDYKTGKFWLSPQVKNGTLPDKITALCSDDGDESTASPTATPGASSDGSQLGVKIGVPVAASVCAALGILAFMLFRRRRKQPPTSKSETTKAPATSPSTATLNTAYPTSPTSTYFTPAPTSFEMNTHPTELESPGPKYPMFNTPSELSAHPVPIAELDSRPI
ncbi:hypothetical protein AK830_g6008 [Neonectria ditissima]|uniref:Peptidase A1 domain-containing protein n=1 Tax=Neonectria ditissima TaxID=78410 RepID=A0A0N8H718_9HYPO|nr:hypothetical protein AK830_g6008 [Neonectria ditissima]